MSPDKNEALLLQHWLNAQPRSVNQLLQQAHRLAEINRQLRQWSDEPWLTQVRVVNLRDGVVVVFCTSAAVLVPLRHRTQELLAWLNQRFQLGCHRLETKISPPPTKRQGRV